MAISLADEDGVLYLEAIEEYIKAKIPVEWAEDDLFVNDFKRVARPKYKKDAPAGGRGSARPPLKGSRTALKGAPTAAKAPAVKPVAAQVNPETGEPAKKRRRRRKKPGGEGSPAPQTTAEKS